MAKAKKIETLNKEIEKDKAKEFAERKQKASAEIAEVLAKYQLGIQAIIRYGIDGIVPGVVLVETNMPTDEGVQTTE